MTRDLLLLMIDEMRKVAEALPDDIDRLEIDTEYGSGLRLKIEVKDNRK